MGPGGRGQVISVRPFYSDDPSSNHAEVNSFFLEVNCLKRRCPLKIQFPLPPKWRTVKLRRSDHHPRYNDAPAIAILDPKSRDGIMTKSFIKMEADLD